MTVTDVVSAHAVSRTFGYGTRAVVALHDATCTLRTGDRIALVGPSGSGKSTLLHLLAGIDQPTVGTIDWPGLAHDLRGRPIGVGVVFQGPSLLPALDVIENVALPLMLSGADDATALLTARHALERVGIEDLATSLPGQISGGQAQRVAVARALAISPRILLADEPTGQLDHDTAGSVVDALIATADATGAALLIATHDPAVAERLSMCWSMDDGLLTDESVSWSH